MDDDHPPPQKRGPYKTYLTNPDIPIPRTTKSGQQNRAKKDETVVPSDDSEYEVYDIELVTRKNKSVKLKSTKPHAHNPPKRKINQSRRELDFPHDESFADDLPNVNEFGNVIHAEDSDYSSESENDVDLISDENESDDAYSTETDIDESEYNENPWSDEEETDMDNESEQKQKELYDGSRVTTTQSNLITVAYSLRHNLPDVGLENLISVLDCHLPEKKIQSKYHLLKSQPVPKTTEYYYCDDCSEILSFDEQQKATCRLCQKLYEKMNLKKNGKYFISLSLKEQLEEIIKSDLYREFRNSCGESDVLNSRIYRKLKKDKVINDNDITLQMNVDGVSLSKSSKASLWPILVMINELPYRTRKSNVLICGLWYGDKKPPMNMYLTPFVEELISLSNEGIQVSMPNLHGECLSIKVHTILCTVDSVARAMVQNWKQFNGAYGCPYCLHKGERIAVGRGFSRVYCYKQMRERTHNDYDRHVKLAVEAGKVVKGVKGPSILSSIPNMHVIFSCPPDYMHSFLLGVVKLFVRAWFDSKYKNEPFYLGKHLQEFINRLMRVKPPSEVTRTPRPISETYKANEWENLLLYFSTACLKGIMDRKYLNHWGLLVLSLNILLQEKITKDQIKQAEDALHSFVSKIESLYKKEFLRFNVHLLLHLPKFVSMYGALWAWSNFPFEGFNGVIRHLYFGTQYIPLQISKLYCRLRHVRNNAHYFSGDDVDPAVLSTFLKLMNQCKVKNCIEYGNDLRAFGKAKSVKLSVLEKHVIQQQVGYDIAAICEGFDRFIYKHTLFHSSNYRKSRKRCNCVIQTNDGKIMKIVRLLKIDCLTTGEIKYVIIGLEYKVLNETLYTGPSPSIESQGYCFITRETRNIVCYEVQSIKTKCIDIAHPTADRRCIFLLVNKLETD